MAGGRSESGYSCGSTAYSLLGKRRPTALMLSFHMEMFFNDSMIGHWWFMEPFKHANTRFGVLRLRMCISVFLPAGRGLDQSA